MIVEPMRNRFLSRVGYTIGALALLACETTPRTPETATATARTEDTVAHTLAGIELQAKPLIPAMQNQLQQLATQPPDRVRENLTAHKHQLADLVTAMRADLTRTEQGPPPGFLALADSALEDIGGGTGLADGIREDFSPEQLDEHLARVRRLIGMYEQAIRSRESSPTP